MKITLEDVQRTVQCGDVITVVYRKADGVARLLRWAENGRASHAIECFGGLDTFEETIGGGMHTNLDTYLRGNADLTVKRVRGSLDHREQARVCLYWMGLVAKGYGWDSIKRAALTAPIRRFVKPRYPRLAATMFEMARELLPGDMPDCSAAWVAGIRLVRPHVLAGYRPEEVTPETLLRDHDLVTVEKWTKPVLEY